MTENDLVESILPKLEGGSILEKIVGKRQSIIFSLLLAAIYFAHAGQNELASVILGFIGMVVKAYIDDVSGEKRVAA